MPQRPTTDQTREHAESIARIRQRSCPDSGSSIEYRSEHETLPCGGRTPGARSSKKFLVLQLGHRIRPAIMLTAARKAKSALRESGLQRAHGAPRTRTDNRLNENQWKKP
jgi:hypothetical protein